MRSTNEKARQSKILTSRSYFSKWLGKQNLKEYWENASRIQNKEVCATLYLKAEGRTEAAALRQVLYFAITCMHTCKSNRFHDKGSDTCKYATLTATAGFSTGLTALSTKFTADRFISEDPLHGCNGANYPTSWPLFIFFKLYF